MADPELRAKHITIETRHESTDTAFTLVLMEFTEVCVERTATTVLTPDGLGQRCRSIAVCLSVALSSSVQRVLKELDHRGSYSLSRDGSIRRDYSSSSSSSSSIGPLTSDRAFSTLNRSARSASCSLAIS